MLEAAAWGLLGGSSLVIGAVLGLYAGIPGRVVGLITGFGAGTLISALAFELTAEAFELGGADVVALGLGLGAISFYAGDRALTRRGMPDRRMSGEHPPEEAGGALFLGAVLDGVPESVVIGSSLVTGGAVSPSMVAAVFLSNLPEALSAGAGMPHEHRCRSLGMWTAVALICALSSALGYLLLESASGELTGLIQAFAGGAVLMTVADAMLPEARKLGGPAAGLMTVFGFALTYLLSTL